MPKSDNLKDRLNELFSIEIPGESPEGGYVPSPAAPAAEAPIVEIPPPSAAVFETAFENLSLGMALVDIQGCFMRVNSTFGDVLGYSIRELEGMNFQAITYAEDLPVGADSMRAMLSGATDTAHIQKRYVQKGGKIIWVDLNITLLRESSGKPKFFVTIARDVTEAKQSEELLSRRATELATVAQVGTAAASILDPGKLLKSVVELIKERFYLYHTHVYLVDAKEDWLALAAGSGDAGKKMLEAGWKIQLENEHSLVARSARSRKGVIINDVRATPDFMANEFLPETRSELAVPLIAGDKLLGVLDVQSDEINHFTQEDISIHTALASQVAVALQNAQLVSGVEGQAQTLAVFNEMVRSVAQNINLDEALETTYQYIKRLMPLDAYIVGLYDEARNMMQYPLTYDEGVRYEASTGQFNIESNTGKVIATGEPILILVKEEQLNDDLTTELSTTGMGQADKASASLLYVPLKLGEKTIGVLSVQSYKVNAYTEQHVELMQNIANQIVVAIQNARHFTRMQSALADAHQSEELIYSVINASPDWIFVKDLDHRFLLVNESFSKAMHHRREEFVGKNDLEIGFPEETVMGNPEKGIQGLWWVDQQVMEGGEEQITNGEVNIVDGETHYFDVYKAPLIDAQGKVWGMLGYARDVTERQVTLAESEALYEGSARVVAAGTVQEVLLAVVESTSLNQFDHGTVMLFEHAWTTKKPITGTLAATWERSGEAPYLPAGTTFKLSEIPLTSIAKPNEPVFIKDIETDELVDPRTRAILSEKGRSLALFPLVTAGQWIGWLVMQGETTVELTNEELRQVQSLSNQAATVIQGRLLERDMQERLAELTNLQRLMSREAWAAYQSQASSETRGYLFSNASVQPVTVEMASLGGNGHFAESVAGQPVDQPVITSLSVRGEHIGTLGVQVAPGQILAPEDEAFLEAISEQVAQALERARLMEQTQRSAVELQAVAEVSTASSTILDPQELLQTVVDLTKKDFGLYHAHVYLLDSEYNALVLSAGAGEIGRSMTAEGWSIPVNQENSIVASTAKARKGQLISDVRKEAQYLPNPMLPDTKSELAVPMVVGDRLLGVFDVQSDAVGRFGEEDIRTYTTLASQVAVALQNAKLYTEQLATVERLRELDNMKSAFLANMSHELRTPLNSILGFTQVIEEGLDGPLTDLMFGDLGLIEKNGKHLLNLINDVLDMAKIEAGRLSLSLEPLDIYELLDDVIVTNNPLAREKSLYMRLEADKNENWTVSADHVRMRQIFINIVGNAVKFTDDGGITIGLEKLYGTSEAELDRIRIRIKDTGVGIPATKLEEIFQAFSQVDNTTTRKAGGTGLGLPISRRLVELHGGRMWAESRGLAGDGTTILVELPITKDEG